MSPHSWQGSDICVAVANTRWQRLVQLAKYGLQTVFVPWISSALRLVSSSVHTSLTDAGTSMLGFAAVVESEVQKLLVSGGWVA